MITIELVCQHEPHRCRCRHDARTQVDRAEVAGGLLKHNPALLKYFGKRIHSTQAQNPQNQKMQLLGKINEPYLSIVEQKGLKFVLSNNTSNLPMQRPQNQKQSVRQNTSNNIKNQQQPQIMVQPPQPIRKIAEIPKKQINKQSSKEKQLKKYHKQLKNQSRYLSDTAFRKYFNRQCFQNYGRNNTTNKIDGFVYGNYMKTFSINPHTGENMPINQQTFYHALVSGSPEKYELYNQQVKLGLTESRIPLQKQMRSLEKQKFNVQKMLEDNQKHSRLQHKYEHIRLKSGKQKSGQKKLPKSRSPKILKPIMKEVRQQKGDEPPKINLPSQLDINTRKNFEEDRKIKKSVGTQPKNQKITPANFQGTIDQLKPNITSIFVQAAPEQRSFKQVSKVQSINQQSRKLSNKESFQSPQQLKCSHDSGHNSVQCACCVNKMKQFILQLSEKDPDLANRILTSAKKTTLYKNFALNNYETAAMNPKNYRPVNGKLNVFEKQ